MAVTDLNEIMKQAKKMQEHFQESQKELEKVQVIGESGAGLVKVHMDGRHTVFNVELEDALVKEDKELAYYVFYYSGGFSALAAVQHTFNSNLYPKIKVLGALYDQKSRF